MPFQRITLSRNDSVCGLSKPGFHENPFLSIKTTFTTTVHLFQLFFTTIVENCARENPVYPEMRACAALGRIKLTFLLVQISHSLETWRGVFHTYMR